MSGLSCRFLRPSAFRAPTSSAKPAHARFFSALHMCLSKPKRAHPEEQSSNDYRNRVKQLQDAGNVADYYPRFRSAALDGKGIRRQDFLAKYEHLEAGQTADDSYTIPGRITSVRSAGTKLLFIDIDSHGQGTEPFQTFCNYRMLSEKGLSEEEWRRFRKLARPGDWVHVTGYPHRSNSNELSLLATALPQILAPSLNQINADVEDQKLLSLHKHVDLIVNPRASDVLRLRALIIRVIRKFFESRDFLEVSTPLLAADAGGAAARPFQTRANDFANQLLSLRIAPELYLKRLVVGNIPQVFEVGQAFRNEAVDRTHNPEFTICEAYAAFNDLERTIALIEQLLRILSESVARWRSEMHTPAQLTIPHPPGWHLDDQPFPRLSFLPTLERELRTTLNSPSYALPDFDNPHTARTELPSLLMTLNLPIPPQPSVPRMLNTLQAHILEPCCHGSRPTFLIHPPAALSPLAKTFTDPDTGRQVAARVELFVNGSEVANAYEEENSPFAQRDKFVQQRTYELEAAAREGEADGEGESGEQMGIDESYIEALGWGLPPVAGLGLGVDRLVMLFAGANRIADVLSFGNLRNVVSAAQNRPGR